MNPLRRFAMLYAEALWLPVTALRGHAALLRMLVQREIVNRTSGTLLGRLWPLLQPALQVLGFWFLFAVVYDMQNVRGPGYAQYLLLGILPWLCFSELLARATGLFREFGALYARSPFPLHILPVVILVLPTVVYTLVLALTADWLLGAAAALKTLLLVPALVLWTLPLVLLCAVVGLFVRDFGQALPFLLTLLLYLTPILYFPDMLPAGGRALLWLNPMADWMALVHAFLGGSPVTLAGVARLAGLWLLLLGPCWLLYRRTMLHAREIL
jgi:lipopolysaccharide transport system permease protein